MSRHAGFLLTLLLLGSGDARAQKPPARPGQERTSDQTRQLIVSGGNQRQRTALMRVLEGLRETTLRVLKQPLQSYPTARPILCILAPEYPLETAPGMELLEDPGGLKVQLRLGPVDGTPTPQLERALLSGLLAELALRPFPNAETTGCCPPTPRWLVDVLFHEHHRPNPLLSPVSLRELLDSGRIPSPVPILARPELEPVPSSPEEVDLARCLLSFLLNRPGGKEGMQLLLRHDLTEGTLPGLLACFPTLPRSEAQLMREWTVHVAAAGTQAERIALNGPQTEAEIRNLLLFDHTDPATGEHSVFSLEQFAEILRLPGCGEALLARQIEFESLRGRAHFLYIPVIDAYALACNALAGGRTVGVVRQLQLATLERESVAARLERIRDQLNWFEAVAAPRLPSARLAEFYRILNARPPVSRAVQEALDQAELRLRQGEALEDAARASGELRPRPRLTQ